MTLASLQVKVVGERSRSNAKNRFFTSLLLCFRVKVKSRGQGHRSGSKSKVKVKFLAPAVDIRGLTLLSAAESYNHHYQSEAIVFVSVIKGRMRIILRMRLIGF